MTDGEISDMNKYRLFDAIMAAMAEGIGEKYMNGEFNAEMLTKISTMSMSSLEELLSTNILTLQKINVTTAEEENGEGEDEEGGDDTEEDEDMGGEDEGGGDEDPFA